MHPAQYDPHRATWAQLPYNGHTGPGELGGFQPAPPPPHLVSPPAGAGLYSPFSRGHMLPNGGIFPSPPFSTSSQVRSLTQTIAKYSLLWSVLLSPSREFARFGLSYGVDVLFSCR